MPGSGVEIESVASVAVKAPVVVMGPEKMVSSPGVVQPVKKVVIAPEVVGLKMATDEMEQPFDARIPPTESLWSEEAGTVMLPVRMDGSSRVQFTVEGPRLGKLLGRFRL